MPRRTTESGAGYSRPQVLRDALVSNPDPDDNVLFNTLRPRVNEPKSSSPLWLGRNRGLLRELERKIIESKDWLAK